MTTEFETTPEDRSQFSKNDFQALAYEQLTIKEEAISTLKNHLCERHAACRWILSLLHTKTFKSRTQRLQRT